MKSRRIDMRLPLKMFDERDAPSQRGVYVFQICSNAKASRANHFLINDTFAQNVAEIKERENFQAFVLRDGDLIFETAAQALFAAHKTFLVAANRIYSADKISVRRAEQFFSCKLPVKAEIKSLRVAEPFLIERIKFINGCGISNVAHVVASLKCNRISVIEKLIVISVMNNRDIRRPSANFIVDPTNALIKFRSQIGFCKFALFLFSRIRAVAQIKFHAVMTDWQAVAEIPSLSSVAN